MNVLQVNTTYQGGGAEKVTQQLFHSSFPGITQHLLVGRGDREESRIKGYSMIYDGGLPWFCSRAYGKLAPYRRYDPYATHRIISYVKEHGIDIVHLQNIHGNYMGILDVEAIAKHAKIIWTLHDMWAMTGHCAHAFECDGYRRQDCSNCPRKETYPSIRTDCGNAILQDKKRAFTGKGITFVLPSKWLKERALESILAGEDLRVIENGSDTAGYGKYVGKKEELRQEYDIPKDRTVLLFAASNLNSQFRSFGHLLDSLEYLEDRSAYTLIVLGNCDESVHFPEGFDVRLMGYIKDQDVMAKLYALSDAYVSPSLADNFPCTTVESFAVGTPVIAFASGGLVEQLSEGRGILVPTGDVKSLAHAFETLRTMTPDAYGEMSRRCLTKAREEWDLQVMLSRYRDLYEEVYAGKPTKESGSISI